MNFVNSIKGQKNKHSIPRWIKKIILQQEYEGQLRYSHTKILKIVKSYQLHLECTSISCLQYE